MDSLVKIPDIATPAASVANKLIETVSKGLGTLYKPRSIRNQGKAEADAKAYEIVALAKAQATANGITASTESIEATVNRVLSTELKRQDNIDFIVEEAYKLLADKKVSEEAVDTDWSTRFFNTAQDISDEEMKLLWARVLATEIEHPNRFSLRSIDLLKNLSKKEAEIFMKFAKYVIRLNGTFFIWKQPVKSMQHNLSFDELLLLRELGLIQNSDLVLNLDESTQEVREVFTYGKSIIIYSRFLPVRKKTIDIYLLTTIGEQLFSLTDCKADLQYFKEFGKSLKTDNDKVELSTITDRTNSNILYKTPTEIL